MGELKAEFEATTDYKRRLMILTASPFSQRETAKFFGTSQYMVKRASKLKETHGILPDIGKISRGHKVSDDDKAKVRAFYESDEVSRMCPGRKDYVTVTDPDGARTKVQKRLILGTLRELYCAYKEDATNPKIGFSTFASLRPKRCVLAGSAGTHTVCVCTYHHNPKLILAALGLPDMTIEDLMRHSVCDLSNRDCMMGSCAKCPGEEGVADFLAMALSGEDSDDGLFDDICYHQWVSTDRCNLVEVVACREECVQTLSHQIKELTTHHYRAVVQSRYFSEIKEKLKEGQVVVQGDFSENYSFVVQDAAQGFYWDSSQCTVHPFVAYWQQGSVLRHQSFCFISDDMKHNTSIVHAFIRRLIPELKEKVPGLEKVIYFSDGCASQYKNKYNFLNLCHHEKDFPGVKCEWHFFATAHGKGACDGIGGTVKRATRLESLRRPVTGQILTAEGMAEFLSEKFVSVIDIKFVSRLEVEKASKDLQTRYETALTIKGTKKLHRFVPISTSTMRVHELSTDDGYDVKISV